MGMSKGIESGRECEAEPRRRKNEWMMCFLIDLNEFAGTNRCEWGSMCQFLAPFVGIFSSNLDHSIQLRCTVLPMPTLRLFNTEL